MGITQELLKQYNKNSPYKRKKIDSKSDDTQRFGTWSYANTYDALYDKYSQNKNFNANMWMQSMKLGEQDQYFAFLEKNKDNTLSKEFYDPQYYDYESMMLEMYLPFADNTELKPHEQEVYDAINNKWVTEKFEMTDQQYIQYQLNTVRQQKAAEIQRMIEQEHKDQLDFWELIGNDIAATLAEFGEGVLSGLTGMIDFFAGFGYATYGAIANGDNWGDAFVEYFGEKGLTAAEKRVVRTALDEYERTHTHFRDIDGNITGVGTYLAGISNSIGMMLPAIALNAVTGGAAFVGSAAFYTSIFSHNMYENATDYKRANSPSALKIGNAALKTGIEAIIEYGLTRILGGTIQNKMLGIKGRVPTNINFTKWSGIKYWLKSAGQEGLEEFLQDFTTNLVDQAAELWQEGAGYGDNGVTGQTLIDSLIIGFLSSLVMSAGRVAFDSGISFIKNHRTADGKWSKANTGRGDVIVETNKGTQKIKGFNKLYYSSIVSDFNNAVKELKKGKFSTKQNLALAQDVYGAFTTMSQLYTSIGEARLKNAEMLLSRVIKAEENFKTEHSEAASILTDKTIGKIVKGEVKSRGKVLAYNIQTAFANAMEESRMRHMTKALEKIDDNVADKLEEGGVTTVNTVVNEQIKLDRDTTIKEHEKRLGTKAKSRLDELSKDYAWVFTTDGHVAIESDDILFVSEAWLENYETHEIYKFLTQAQVLDNILDTKELMPMIDELVKFNKEFTGQKLVTRERALMDFLFNKTVYQKFLLSNSYNKNDNRANVYKDFVFTLYNRVEGFSKDSKYYNQKFKGHQSQYRINLLKQITQQMRDTMREPTIKAIINWGFNPQLIGADIILSKKDRDFINQYKARRNIIANAAKPGGVTSAYANLVKDIIPNGKFITSERDIITSGLKDDVDIDTRLQAVALLDEANDKMNVSLDYDYTKSVRNEIASVFKDVANSQNANDKASWKTALDTVLNIVNSYEFTNVSDVIEYENHFDILTEKIEDTLNNENSNIQDYVQMISKSLQLLDSILSDLRVLNNKPSVVGAFTLPLDDVNLIHKNDFSDAQFEIDVRNEFLKRYGITADDLIVGNFIGMSIEQRDILTRDMEIFGTNNYAEFVISKLEQMLGNRYMVIPKYFQPEKGRKITRLEVVTKIPASIFLSKNILNEELSNRNRIFAEMFSHSNTRSLNECMNTSTELVSDNVKKILNNIEVIFEDFGEQKGKHSSGKVYINPRVSDDYFETLVHEVNHELQDELDLPGGFSSKRSYHMPDFLVYVANHYPIYVEYVARRNHTDISIQNLTKQSLTELPDEQRRTLAYCAYRLVQGELWSRGYMHNGKSVRGFTKHGDGIYEWILSPDGHTTFQINDVEGNIKTEEASPSITPEVAESALDVAIKRIFDAKRRIEQMGYDDSGLTRNTYHSSLTKSSNMELTRLLINPALRAVDKYTVNIDKIIKDPMKYLSNELKQMCDGDFSEGNVFYRVKEYIEANTNGISIDRTDSTHEYVFVDDNAYDDLLLTSMLSKAENTDKTLYDKFKDQGRIPLTAFYKEKLLAELGINPSAFIVIAPDVATETRIDDKHQTGAIYIRADENTTDNIIIDRLNHEFRHLLQYYNDFETGFTPDFVVTKEMIADVKAHAPGIFKDSATQKWARENAKISDDSWEAEIVKRFVYFLVGGELNAYAFDASWLTVKPVYVTTEAGNPTIFMPWYNAKTGEGRYKTKFLAMRADDSKAPTTTQKKKKGINIPSTDKRYKYKAVSVYDINDTETMRQYLYDNPRRNFTKAMAEGTNLEFFIKKGQRNQMDPDLQQFIIATTDELDKLPKELAHAIKRGILTKQALFKWFREADADSINDFTFNLLNKHFFKNDYIHNMQELNEILTLDPSFYWATMIVLRREGLSLENLIKENDVDHFVDFIESFEGTKWKNKIEKMQLNFDKQWISDGKGGYKLEDIGDSDKVRNYMRVLTMQWFDGTLSGAFYMANAYRKTIRLYEEESRGIISLDATTDNAKGDKETTRMDILTDKDIITGNNKATANDILAIYELEIQTDKSPEEMLNELALAYMRRVAEKNGINFDRLSDSAAKKIAPLGLKYIEKYRPMLETERGREQIAKRYADIISAEITGNSQNADTLENSKEYSRTRVNIVARIKRTSDAILKLISEGKVAFSALPNDVQDMFNKVSAKTDAGKTITGYELKPEVYSVGRGRKALPGTTDKYGRLNYQPKHNITEGNEAFRHDVSEILVNDEKLRLTLTSARQAIKNQQMNIKQTVKSVERMQKKLDKTILDLKSPKPKIDKRLKNTEIRVSKKVKKTSDTPNIFNIVSGSEMPTVLRKIFDTSFDDFASTEVQFASRDESGQLYEKDKFKKGEFKSRVQHEITNWDAFYEANRETLLDLTRNDVLDIIEFFKNGASTIDGPLVKLEAFQVFIMGYIVAEARANTHNWNFSESEKDVLERMYEALASKYGTGLKAVQQMLNMVNPLKKIYQRMLEDFNITEPELDNLVKSVNELQNAKDTKSREAKTKEVIDELKKVEALMRENGLQDKPGKKKGWWTKNWYQKMKSYRYLAMLSSPTTHVRNVISNWTTRGINATSDLIAKAVFSKKGYRKEQWNLSDVQVSNKVKTFIDDNIKNNELFDKYLYDTTSKYDNCTKKKLENQKDLFINIIVNSIKQKYAAENKFTSKVGKAVTAYVSMMVSDKRFIKKVTNKYLGKILTIEVAKGNVDLSKGLSNEVLNLFAEAVIIGNTEYMHKRSFLADMIDGLRDKHPVAYEALTLWQPFLNSGFNWFTETLKYTPLGLANSIKNMIKLEQKITDLDARRAAGEMVTDSRMAEFLARRDIGKGILGLILSSFGVLLALSGRIRIDDDDDKLYMFIGDLKIDISNVFGSSTLLVSAAVTQGALGNTDFDGTMRLVAEQMFEGFILNDMLERHRWDEGFWDGMLTETESILRSFVPQMWQLIVRTTNSEQIKYSPGTMGMIERWLNSWLPTQPLGERKVNPYTGNTETKYAIPFFGELFKSGIIGPKLYWSEVSEQERMCREYGVNKGMLTGEITIDGKKKTLNQQYLNEKYGQLNADSLSKIKSQKHKVEMPDGTYKTLSWDKLSDEQKARVINRTMTQNAEIAKVYVWTQQMGKKYYASDSLWLILKQLGITQNVYKGDKGFVE